MHVKVPQPFPRHAFSPTSDDTAFHLRDGTSARSLEELATRLREATAETAWFHREHLAPWLHDVVGDAPLARRFEHYAEDPPAADAYRDVVLALVERRLADLAPHRHRD